MGNLTSRKAAEAYGKLPDSAANGAEIISDGREMRNIASPRGHLRRRKSSEHEASAMATGPVTTGSIVYESLNYDEVQSGEFYRLNVHASKKQMEGLKK